MSTFIHGIGQCQIIDKSGEMVDLKGHDITSLPKTGTFTWEHKNDSPATLVGKIIKAKKIFSKEECENEHELRFWNKCKTAYLYVMGELLDDYTSSAKECAGQIKYSRDNPDKAPLLGFSVEGSEIPNTRKGMVITRSIARKITLTNSPCNSMCILEIYENTEPSQVKDDFEQLFRSEQEAITLFKSGEGINLYEQFLAKKEISSHLLPVNSKDPKTFGKRPVTAGTKIGTTSTGKDVTSHGHVGEYGFNSTEHKEAGELHRKAAVSAKNSKLGDVHMEKMKLHNQAALTSEHKEGRMAAGLASKRSSAMAAASPQMTKNEKCPHKSKPLKKEDMSAPPAEPNSTSAAEMQAGATSGGPSFSQAMNNLSSGLGMGKSDLNKGNDRLNPPVFSDIPGKKLRAWNPGIKNGIGTSHMGAHVRNQTNPRSSDSSKEVSKVRAKQIAGKNLKRLQETPKPNLPKSEPEGDLKKTLEAGSGNAAPSTLVNGAAYQSESLGSKPKKDWNRRAKDEYENWPQREKFEKFMRARLPHLADGEIQAIGRVLSLKKSIEFEKSLDSLVKKSDKENS